MIIINNYININQLKISNIFRQFTFAFHVSGKLQIFHVISTSNFEHLNKNKSAITG